LDASGALKDSVSMMKTVVSYAEWIFRAHPQSSKGRINVDDIDIFFRRFGSGKPVLLLHGGFMFAETWAGQIPALSSGYLLFAPDLRGHGRTTLGKRPMTYRQLADDALGLIEAFKTGPAHVVGWSDGGCTALGMAIKRPDLVRSITLLGTPWNVSNYSEKTLHDLVTMTNPMMPDTMVLMMLRRLLTPEHYRGREFLAALRKMWLDTLDFTIEELHGIETPTLVIATDHDQFLSEEPDPLKMFRELTEAIPAAEMAVVPGGTHLVQIARPDVVNPIIMDFLNQID
jgi:pimeloyl-ACP methyl ester carboxylesterase